MYVLEYYCVKHSLRVGILDSADMCTVVVRGGLEVPAVDNMIVTGGACVGIIMYGYGAYHWAKGYYVLVEGYIH